MGREASSWESKAGAPSQALAPAVIQETLGMVAKSTAVIWERRDNEA